MEFIIIAILLVLIFEYNQKIDSKKFFKDAEPYFKFLIEDDYVFLAKLKYGDDINANSLFSRRVRDAALVIVLFIFIFMLTKINYINILFSFIVGFAIFKLPYIKLKGYYKANLAMIDQMLPYYLKSLEILIQHYTVPVALAKSVETAPDIFKSGLKTLVAKIEAGNSTVDPYMDFAKEYPVRDAMRMMRLLYRLSLGSQENKQEQLVLFAKNVSTLQNKTREIKYKDRLETMEKKTMLMLMVTGGGVLVILMFAMFSLMGI